LTAAPGAISYTFRDVIEKGSELERPVDTTHFDRIAKIFAVGQSRRDALRLLGASALAASGLTFLAPDEGEAKKNRKNNKKKKKCKGKCGGKCPRCTAGKTCDNRDQCTTALCENNVCTVVDDAGQCDLDTNGDNCFRRENLKNGEFYCSRQTCRLDGVNSCADCKGGEVCSPQGGNGFECCKLCGS
jgi:hypothetical protein